MASYTTITSDKSKKTALLLCCLGYFGLGGFHYFYVGRYLRGIVWFLTAGLFFIGTLADTVKIASGSFRDNVGVPLRQ